MVPFFSLCWKSCGADFGSFFGNNISLNHWHEGEKYILYCVI